MIKTRNKTARYFQPGEIEPGFNSIYFENEGTNDVIINGKRITPGNFFTDNGFQNEMNTTVYRFTFEGAGINNLLVIAKRFIV